MQYYSSTSNCSSYPVNIFQIGKKTKEATLWQFKPVNIKMQIKLKTKLTIHKNVYLVDNIFEIRICKITK
jgi:hypothetical protein